MQKLTSKNVQNIINSLEHIMLSVAEKLETQRINRQQKIKNIKESPWLGKSGKNPFVTIKKIWCWLIN